MVSLIIRLLINAVVILLLAMYVPGMEVTSYGAAMLFAVVLGVINAVIRPILKIFTFPITIMTIGLFTLVLNALLFWLASLFVIGVTIDSFAAAFWSALGLTIVSWFTSMIVRK